MSQSDLGIVYGAVAQLSQRGISCYVAERDWQFGSPLPAKIESAIRAADAFVAFWTIGGAYSQYVNQEIGVARGMRKLRILMVERGVQVQGFDIDKEYISLDRSNPSAAISTLGHYLERKKGEKESAQGALAVIGVIGLLLLSAYGGNNPKGRRCRR